jgi:hypothetical protein
MFLLLALLAPAGAAAEGDARCQIGGVEVAAREVPGGVVLEARLPGVQDATIDLTAQLTNMTSDPPLPATVDVHAGRTTELARFRIGSRQQAWRYSWRYWWLPGGREARPDPGAVYALPFDAGRSVEVLQGPGGAFSHGRGSGFDDAIDFDVPEGTTVRAARGGTVIAVRDDSDLGGPDRSFEPCANHVMVRHDDGTYANYHHLQRGSAQVRLGQKVSVGTPLGRSGNTGFSTRPHLHFDVFHTVDGQHRETFPVRFETSEGVLALREGRRYRSP